MSSLLRRCTRQTQALLEQNYTFSAQASLVSHNTGNSPIQKLNLQFPSKSLDVEMYLFSSNEIMAKFCVSLFIMLYFRSMGINCDFVKPCFKDEEVKFVCQPNTNMSCYDEKMVNLRLSKLDGVKVGHVQRVELEDGRWYTLKTRAIKPTIFEIPDFLSDYECDHIIELAKTRGMEQSVAGFMKDIYEGELDMELNAVDVTRPAEGPDELLAERFDTWDKNNDSIIDFDEISTFAFNYDKLYLKEKDIIDMLRKIGFKRSKEDIISEAEFEIHGVKKILTYLHYLKDKHPLYRHRLSDQTWLYRNSSDPVLHALTNRVTRLTKLPSKFVQTSEAIQVVRYQENGHYHAHFDSNPTVENMYCCHQNLFGSDCTLCRFITILYYLNDVDEGGETAFPIADQENLNDTSREINKQYDELNLTEHCKNASLVLPPKKGTAVMWYNHYIDRTTGFLGNLDKHSVHGGCDIRKGSKWIANNWIAAPTSVTSHIKSIYDVA